ncbi:nuclear factor 7, brain isoform X4 [Lates calcarifer]|uniref:Nuclear factor 7, brain isoform X4 n=1 Tax=Lates calcarifer TaxID=8187 RepID=A0A4W6BTM5_LATCA|nr:nuclear factor 7, brain isoform X4 [Lates calcarifer]
MASAYYSEDLTCSICLTIFTDPVTLLCGHSFCRQCITDNLYTQHQCPQCRTAVPTEGTCLPTSHILKSLAEKAKEAENIKKEHGHEKAEVAELCPEHEEKLKLFCVTDQQLACIICRDAEEHERHKFKPIKEAAASLRRELETGMEKLCGDIDATESLASTQREEITKTKTKSQQLMTQICRQFEEMHQFLRKREDEIKNDLKHREEDAVEKMSETLHTMETALSESRELEGRVTSALEIKDPERFLKCWTEENNRKTPEHLFRPRADELQVVNTALCLGPYESHLQFFVWKEMLQVIQPRAELLSLKSDSRNITVSDDGKHLMYSPEIIQSKKYNPLYRQSSSYSYGYDNRSMQQFETVYIEDTSERYASAFSSTEFTSGQHYWEIEVGKKDYWKIGVKNSYLTYYDQKYVTSSQETELTFTDRPQKIGIYLNCQSKELSFYDAENMTHIHTMTEGCMSVPVAAYFEYKFSRGADHYPLKVCCY